MLLFVEVMSMITMCERLRVEESYVTDSVLNTNINICIYKKKMLN